MNLNCIFDSKSYNIKPQKADMSLISNRLINQDEQILSVNDFIKNVASGKSYLSGRIIDKSLGRKADNFKDINFFSLDVDNDTEIKYTQKQVKDMVFDIIGITPLFTYRTFTGFNIDNSERFRMVYGLESEVDAKTISIIIGYILEKTGNIFDKACIDASRMFSGTNLVNTTRANINATSKPLSVIKTPVLLTDTKIAEMVLEQEKKDADIKTAIAIIRLENIAKYKNSTNSGNGEFNEDAIYQLQQIDIHNYLGVNSSKGNICCPIHSGKDKNFSIHGQNGVYNKVTCHSRGCIKGGSIIDLHMALNNINAGQSIKELCKMYNIEQFKPRPVVINSKKTSDFIVNKYISEDKKILDEILDIVKTNNKILLTGAMGCGKTHFICNELYEYGQSIGKKVVVVIPGVAQLENLQKNKGVHIVCEGNPFDEDHNSSVIATTPESLPKVVEALGDNNFILVVDESHERITSLSYRTGYKADNVGKAERLAHKIIHLTATTTTLIGDKFDEVITVTSKAVITNKVKIIKVPSKNYSDALLTITKEELEKGRKPILFNNNIEQNTEIKELLEVKNEVVVFEYTDKQQDIFRVQQPNKIIKNEILTSAESVNSKSKSENIKNGTVKADITLLTSAVLAGVDLASRPENELIVGCKDMLIDNIIQLIGRFRSGVEVVLVIPDNETKKEYFDFDFICHERLEGSQQLTDSVNTKPMIRSLYEDGVEKTANIKFINDKWEINPPEIVAKVYENWSRAVLDNPEKLAILLEQQVAFETDDKIIIEEYTEPTGTVMADISKANKVERKEIIEVSKKILLEQDDSTLERLLNKGLLKHIDNISPEVLEQATEWHKAAEKHIDKITLIAHELFKDNEGNIDTAKAFRLFYEKPYSEIYKNIEQKQAREINKFIRLHGLDFYISKEFDNFKTSKDIIQAKIRSYLIEVEHKRGRVTDNKIIEITEMLINKGYIKNKDTKLYLSGDTSPEDKAKAFKQVGENVQGSIQNIYNFRCNAKGNNSISSVKY